MKSNNNPTGISNHTVQTEHEIKRFLKIAKKRKWLILFAFLSLFSFWTAYVITFQSSPKYTASALLTFEDPRDVSALSQDKRANIVGKAGLIKSTSLLATVIKELKLNFGMITENISEEDVFDYLKVDDQSTSGQYRLSKQNGKYDLFFKNEEMNVRERRLLSFDAGDTVNINQMAFVLNQNITPKDIEFKIKKFENSIQNLSNRIAFSFDRSGSLLTVSGVFSSPQFAAEVVNILIDRYAELLLSIQKSKINEVMMLLEDEMELAKNDLERANEKLKQFREQYPWVSLTPTSSTQINQIAEYETLKKNTEQKVNDLRELISKLNGTSEINAKTIITQELLTYLAAEGATLVPAFQGQYTKLNNSRNSLINSYASTHPLVIENENEFLDLIQKIMRTGEDHISRLEVEKSEVNKNLSIEKYKVERLPTKEIQLAELVRDQVVKNDLYENLLTQHNKVKIQNEVQVSTVSVIDRATPPPVQSVMSNLIKRLVIGFFLSLGFGYGLAVVVEFFNRTVENADELQKKIRVAVIGSIPFIEDEHEKSKDFQNLKSKKDSRLITLDYSPTLASETYRDLRTRILYMNQNKQSSSFLITSLKPGEGKSITASNIAVTFAQQKISTVLIDGDVRRGVLHNVFGNKKKPGLSDFIVSNATVDFANINKLIQSTFVPNLFLITAGSPVPNPTELHGSERMKDFVNVLKSRFGMVIIDTPPFKGGSDSIILSNIVDSIIILVKANSTNVEELEQKIEQYPFFNNKILGVILNMVKMDKKKEQYQYSYYHY